MVKGNLLLESETFCISEGELALFSERLEALILVVERCRSNRDNIYGTGDLLYVELLGMPLYEFCNRDNFNLLETQLPGFRNDLYIFLTYDLLKYDAQNLNTCTNINDLNDSFPGFNNGLLGMESNNFNCDSEFAVFNEQSWQEWKIVYLSKNPEFIQWEGVHPYLPNLQYSNQLLGQECTKRFNGDSYLEFYKNAGTMAGSEKAALAIEVGKIIAESNFYQYDYNKSKLNQSDEHLRDIYTLQKNKHSIYLSIDVEKATFEVCDHNGFHLGEYLFDGVIKQNADASGRHNIII